MQGRLTKSKILSNSSSQIRYKHLMKMVDLCKESFSHSFGANYSPEVVGDATFICLNVAF